MRVISVQQGKTIYTSHNYTIHNKYATTTEPPKASGGEWVRLEGEPEMTYNYIQETRKAVEDYLAENQIEPKDFASKDEMYDYVHDECWIADSVTGNASGSYTCDRAKAREYVQGNETLLSDALEEIEGDYKRALNDPEYADVTIRCYVLGDVVGQIVQEFKDEDFGGDE